MPLEEDVKALVACVHGERKWICTTGEEHPDPQQTVLDVWWCAHCGAISCDGGRIWKSPQVLGGVLQAVKGRT